MLGSSPLLNVFTNILQTKLVDKIFHSVIIRNDANGARKPAAKVGKNYVYVGIDDTKGFSCYCRETGPLETVNSERMGSCNQKLYTVQTPHRLVFFNDNEIRDHDDISGILVKAVIGGGNLVKFQRLYTIAEPILQQEAPTGVFNLKTSAYYSAIDFLVVLKLQHDNCTTEINCAGIQNPFQI